MFVQILSLKHLIIYLPNMVKSLKVCAQMKSNIYISQAFMIFRITGVYITPPTNLLIDSILLFQIIISQNEILKNVTTPT